jgi:hypothetical protein
MGKRGRGPVKSPSQGSPRSRRQKGLSPKPPDQCRIRPASESCGHLCAGSQRSRIRKVAEEARLQSALAARIQRVCGGVLGGNGDLGRIRTSDPRVRSAMLYPAELRGQHSAGRLARLSESGAKFRTRTPGGGRRAGPCQQKTPTGREMPAGVSLDRPTLVRPCPIHQRMSAVAGSVHQSKVSTAPMPHPARMPAGELWAGTLVSIARLDEAWLPWKNSAAQSTATLPQTAQWTPFC